MITIYGTLYGSMVKTTIYIEPTVALTLRQLAAAQGRSQAEIIREAISSYASKSARRPRPKGIGVYESGRSDVSERAEELMRHAARSRRWR
jgi:hypothetical protein